jgi:hypothetical protein
VTGIAGVFADEVFRRDAETALEAVTTEQPRSVEPLGRGNRKQTALVRFDGQEPVVLQLCEQRSWLRTESVLLTAIRERTDVPVPSVLAADVTPDTAFMLTSYVPGTDLHEQFRFDGYGRLVVEGRGLTAHSQDWGGWLDEYGRRAVGKLPSEFDPIRRELRSLISQSSRAASPEAHLFPWDFRPGNALVGDDQVSAVDSAGVVTTPGYPELDREGAVAFHRAALAGLL